ncbi:2-hydroxyacid dehydrogenase [Flavilitoribacter nigricans]|uniref:Glyoxylate/hydroxypyruvate reductase A n=1 Tax=Flavilitoribacter nigricans (strain ATCC 23147 / DSM 23189 / NBRC 102662 / NCIMB 1420 / SS-2) TaxID=1122177 RepID=A0A2D0N8D3_FLAN2|nr:glyoxylate/hydroxypyruvate reductase A [Flavilitoribacter nigricans]PHN04771.1 glyoxylate/hydroxypyruvate reductase A [Flavilitoribacter nigricans DSM 23189 = NBRC 102662]
MAIALIITDRDVSALRDQLTEHLNGRVPVWIYPDIPDPAAVIMTVVWKHPPRVLSQFPNLQLVSSFGAGVEHIMQDDSLPPDVAVTRIVDDSLSVSMRNYVLMAILNIQRQFRQLQKNQSEAKWEKPETVELPLRVGVLGLGALGGRIARDLARLNFEVSGFSRRKKDIPGVDTYSAEDKQLPVFLSGINALINVLPHTPDTEGILNYLFLSMLHKQSFLINVGRGSQLVEKDLLHAIDEGFIQEAWLDVFQHEPLPKDHPFWAHERIVITPHIASVTNQEEAARILAQNYRNIKDGQPLAFAASRKAGY